jgi:hypothetical protein
MIVAALLVAAAVALWWPRIAELAYELDLGAVNRRHLAAGALVAAAVVAYAWRPAASPTPAPPPQPEGFSLRGKFVGPTAGSDSQMLAALCEEIAGCLEHDGMKEQPRLTSGAAFDDLRVAAREGRMRGESLGARQPHVRDAIHQYLDAEVGVAGGPVSPEQRAKWVAAYRAISHAAANVTK